MPYVQRDRQGRIVGVFSTPVSKDLEEIDVKDPELGVFLAASSIGAASNDAWIESDLAMVRVVEDVIDILVDRNIIRFDELPAAARDKIIRRRGLRSDLSYAAALLADAEHAGIGTGDDPDDGEKYL